jgi:hypothetical protein
MPNLDSLCEPRWELANDFRAGMDETYKTDAAVGYNTSIKAMEFAENRPLRD